MQTHHMGNTFNYIMFLGVPPPPTSNIVSKFVLAIPQPPAHSSHLVFISKAARTQTVYYC